MADFFYRDKLSGSAIAIGPFQSEEAAREAAQRAGSALPILEILRRKDGDRTVPVPMS